MKFRKSTIVTTLLGVILFGIPVLANADLGISNQTTRDLSFRVNGFCSEHFGNVMSYTIKTIPSANVFNACRYNTQPCEVRVYDAKSCFGKHITTIKLWVLSNGLEMTGSNDNMIDVAGSVGEGEFSLFFHEKNNYLKK